MSDEPRDTGDIAEVSESERLKTDRGEGSNALEGGDDTDGLDAVYAEPGEVVPEEELL